MRDKAYRRQRFADTKKKYRNMIFNVQYFDPTHNHEGMEELIQLYSSTHGKPCSCWMCGNERKYFNKVTNQEKKNEIYFRNWEVEENE